MLYSKHCSTSRSKELHLASYGYLKLNYSTPSGANRYSKDNGAVSTRAEKIGRPELQMLIRANPFYFSLPNIQLRGRSGPLEPEDCGRNSPASKGRCATEDRGATEATTAAAASSARAAHRSSHHSPDATVAACHIRNREG